MKNITLHKKVDEYLQQFTN